jgi:uncharacterized protein (DUF427 family)
MLEPGTEFGAGAVRGGPGAGSGEPGLTEIYRQLKGSDVVTEHRGRVRIEPSHKRLRILFGGQVVVDTDDALYVWESPHYPQYYVPISDVADGSLKPSGTETHSPSRGVAAHFNVHGGEKEAVDAAWTYVDSPIEALRDRVRFDWDAMDAWFEEDEEIFVHPRDPATRVQILPSSRHVTVAVDGVVIAESTRPTFLYETGLPRRTYLPKLDVRMDLLVPTASETGCPYKGKASYWSVATPQGEHTDIAWSYSTPLRESAGITGLVAFYDHRVDLTIDGVLQPQPAR